EQSEGSHRRAEEGAGVAGPAEQVPLRLVDEQARRVGVYSTGVTLEVFQQADRRICGAGAELALIFDRRKRGAKIDRPRRTTEVLDRPPAHAAGDARREPRLAQQRRDVRMVLRVVEMARNIGKPSQSM